MRGERERLTTRNWKLETNCGNAFVCVSAALFTPGHELLHLLGLRHPRTDIPWNIMNYYYSFSDNYPIADKRLTQDQVNTIRKSKHLK
jgi:hypothetical protein